MARITALTTLPQLPQHHATRWHAARILRAGRYLAKHHVRGITPNTYAAALLNTALNRGSIAALYWFA